jgi:hypothetical protein
MLLTPRMLLSAGLMVTLQVVEGDVPPRPAGRGPGSAQRIGPGVDPGRLSRHGGTRPPEEDQQQEGPPHQGLGCCGAPCPAFTGAAGAS